MQDGDIIAHEILTRPRGPDQVSIPIQDITTSGHVLGMDEELDLVMIKNALEKSDALPITLNISVKAANSPKFWEKVRPDLAIFHPEDIIFEILEHDVDWDADISHLEKMRQRGYRFALDDFSIGQDHDNRMAVYGNLVDFVKIDGALVRGGLGDADAKFTQAQFSERIAHIKETCPHAQLIAEYVKTRAEADVLFAAGISGVQGRDLKPHDFPLVAKIDSSCKPEHA